MKIVPLAVCSALISMLAGCAIAPPAPRIDHSYSARGQSERIKFVILHYTVGDTPSSLYTLTTADVSAHYMLTDADYPVIYALVDESRQSNHAGYSNWRIYNQLNAASIGIEIVNPGFRDTPEGRVWYPFKPAQMEQLTLLLRDIVARYKIKPENILGHNEIAPQRKQDPGPLFPWKQLADAGLVAWPDAGMVAARLPSFEAQIPEAAWFQKRLAQHGYAVPQSGELDAATRNVISVFQSKFRQARFDGEPDAETAAILDVLTAPLLKPAVDAVPLPAAPPQGVPTE
ncbi:MAG: N-acetylmuramoyl-L-alanine amidase [Sphingomonadaceae bacterium]